MTYRTLFDVQVRHEFFADAACPDLRVTPSTSVPGGARALERHRLIARPRPGGLEIVGPVDGDGKPLIAFEPDLRLRLDVTATGPDFAHYTDPADWAGRQGPHKLPRYRGSSPGGGALTLDTLAGPHPPAVAAAIEVSGISAGWLAAPPRFTLDLHARRALWTYYLLTARPNGADPELRDDEPDRGLVFERLLLAPGGVSAADDPVGHGLLARNPGRRCFRFASLTPLALRRAPTRRLSLYLGAEQLVRELPSPDIHGLATLTVAPEGPPLDSLFCVLEY